MAVYTETAIHWLNAYRLFALEPLIDLYDNQATQACSCDGPKLIAGKVALRARDSTASIRYRGSHPGSLRLVIYPCLASRETLG